MNVGAAAFFILATINTAVTSTDSQQLAQYLRPALVGIIVFCIIANMLKRGLPVRAFVGLTLYTLAAVYGIAVALLTNSLNIVIGSLLVDVPMTLSGIYLMSTLKESGSQARFQDRHARFFIYYPAIAFGITLALGGIIFGIPPQFNLEYGSDTLGQEQVYSLGITNFYGLATIAALYAMSQTEGRWKKLLLIGISIFFFGLALLGGGRGELLATVFVGAVILLKKRPLFTISIISIGVATAAFFIDDWSTISDSLVIFQRLTELRSGDLSTRDTLFFQAIDLLSNEPECIFFGCGPGFFQKFYNYEFGLYPHNILVESVISFGGFLTFTFLTLVAIGVRKYWKSVKRIDVFMMLTLYFFIIGLKSGSLFGSWIVVAALFNFAALAITKRAPTATPLVMNQAVRQ